jgi:hypothetical protein
MRLGQKITATCYVKVRRQGKVIETRESKKTWVVTPRILHLYDVLGKSMKKLMALLTKEEEER